MANNGYQPATELHLSGNSNIINTAPPNANKLRSHQLKHDPKNLIFQSQDVDRSQLIHKLGNYMVSDYTIGQGSYAKVRLASQIQTSQIFAMKIIKKPETDQAKHYTRIKREVENLKGLRHPNIIQLHDVFQTKRFICIVMEYAPVGDLFELIRSQPEKRLDEFDALRLFKQMVSAVEHCHSQHVVHRDLKPENVLLDANGHVKIADFGFSRTFDPDGSLLSTCCGSVGYAAPELLLGEKYEGPAADIWSLGVILYTMLCGVGPFQVEEGMSKEVEERMLNGEFLDSPHLTKFTQYLISCMFEPDASSRITLSGIKRLLDLYEQHDFPQLTSHSSSSSSSHHSSSSSSSLSSSPIYFANNHSANHHPPRHGKYTTNDEDEIFTRWMEEKADYKRKKKRIFTHRKCDSDHLSISSSAMTPPSIHSYAHSPSSSQSDHHHHHHHHHQMNNNNANDGDDDRMQIDSPHPQLTLLTLNHRLNNNPSNADRSLSRSN